MTTITAGARLSSLRELARYHDLLYFLVWREIKVRYRQAALGVLWAVLQPAGLVAAASLAFSGIAETDVSYPLFVAAGVVPWYFFARAVNVAGASTVENERLITKVFFPRILLPVAAVVGVLVETAITLTLVVVIAGAFRWELLVLVPAMLVVLAVASGVGAAAAALNVRFRDTRYVIPFLVQLGLLLTPVLYPLDSVPEGSRWILELNPLTGALETVRWSLFGGGPIPGSLLPAIGISLVVLVMGTWLFRASEDAFADVI